MKFAFEASEAEDAQEALSALQSKYESVPPEDADVIVVLGGVGWLL